MSELKADISDELARLCRGGQFDENFWQRMFDLDGRHDYFAARERRQQEAYQAHYTAKLATVLAQTIPAKREARRMTKRAKTSTGLLRLYERRIDQDPLARQYKLTSAWIATARDLGVYLERWHQAGKPS